MFILSIGAFTLYYLDFDHSSQFNDIHVEVNYKA